jgi:hypothetical protein
LSKILTFNDGSQLEVCEASTIYNVIIVFSDAQNAITAWDLFTRDNLSHGYIGNDEFSDIIPLDLDMIKDDSGMIIARFESRDKTEMELIKEEIHNIMYSH